MFLLKASIKTQGDFKEDGSVGNPWRLQSSASGRAKIGDKNNAQYGRAPSAFSCVWHSSTHSLFCRQRRWTGTSAGSFGILMMLGLTLFLPSYGKFIESFSGGVTKEGRGITLLQRVGVGLALAAWTDTSAGSFGILMMLGLTLFLPFYDKFIEPFSRGVTKEGRSITLLQKVGVGLALVAILSMALAAAVETKRRTVP